METDSESNTSESRAWMAISHFQSNVTITKPGITHERFQTVKAGPRPNTTPHSKKSSPTGERRTFTRLPPETTVGMLMTSGPWLWLFSFTTWLITGSLTTWAGRTLTQRGGLSGGTTLLMRIRTLGMGTKCRDWLRGWLSTSGTRNPTGWDFWCSGHWLGSSGPSVCGCRQRSADTKSSSSKSLPWVIIDDHLDHSLWWFRFMIQH